MESKVIRHDEAPVTELGGGVTRRVLAYLPAQMAVEVRFEQGAIGAPHAHPHTQCTYVVSGEFVFTVGGKDFPVRPGDSLACASGETHGCVCREAGVLVDVFTPMRGDFIRQP